MEATKKVDEVDIYAELGLELGNRKTSRGATAKSKKQSLLDGINQCIKILSERKSFKYVYQKTKDGKKDSFAPERDQWWGTLEKNGKRELRLEAKGKKIYLTYAAAEKRRGIKVDDNIESAIKALETVKNWVEGKDDDELVFYYWTRKGERRADKNGKVRTYLTGDKIIASMH